MNCKYRRIRITSTPDKGVSITDAETGQTFAVTDYKLEGSGRGPTKLTMTILEPEVDIEFRSVPEDEYRDVELMANGKLWSERMRVG